jgi:hypothetical protein
MSVTSITSVQGLSSPTFIANQDSVADTGAFADLLNSSLQTTSSPANSGAGAPISPSTQSVLLQLQEAGPGPEMEPPTALSGLGGTIDPTQERQFLQGAGEAFARSMDTNGDGSVDEDEVVNKLTASGDLSQTLGERLYDKLSPGDGPMTDAQLAASATSVFTPPWLSTTPG